MEFMEYHSCSIPSSNPWQKSVEKNMAVFAVVPRQYWRVVMPGFPDPWPGRNLGAGHKLLKNGAGLGNDATKWG